MRKRVPRGVVTGQAVSGAKLARAKELRAHMTAEEEMLWRHLRRNQLGGLHFRRQQVIAGFIVDFYCDAVALVVEVDGGIHELQRSYDDARDAVITSRGLRVLRLPAQAVRDSPDRVVAEIAAVARDDSR